MRTNIQRTTGAFENTGGATTETLFDQFAGDKKKALDQENRDILKQDIKMRFHGAINTAKGNIARSNSQINTELAGLGEMNFQRILELEANIAAEQRTIAAAKKYYQKLFGTELTEQGL